MSTEEKHEELKTWFARWFLNNKFVTSLLIILLCLLIIFTFQKVEFFFRPIAQFLGIVGLPLIISGLLYYLLNPIVDFMERKGINRVLTIAVLFVLIIGLIVWGVIIVVPKIQAQTHSFITNWPDYWQTIESKSADLLNMPILEKYGAPLEKALTELTDSVSKFTSSIAKFLSGNAFKGIGNIVGAVADIVVVVITVPFVLFYLLKDGKNLMPYTTKFLPIKMRQPTVSVLKDINEKLSSYVRGQVTVAFAVSIIFMLGLSIIGLEYSVTLGVLAGVLNLIPFLGSALAMIPIVILAMVNGPKMLIAVIIVFIIEQTLEGKVVSPLVLGNQLNIHPLTIIFVLLTAGKLFGLLGVVLGIPGYAAIKVVVSHAFIWYQEVSGLYEPDDVISLKKEDK
ncbi:AI-2E family transporter [Vagococcus penaei]|uniref:AI-2E family transporter n=1 Tax=Vagococcus penaei TaxID=633807 RepID=A0A1Q2D813_9ENTE|nr:AI-2E family transporter [Vagococcus penaei]AQP54450.1 AI-2E family transporter [Vagococcus penaei]RSU06367.1 AI-2E family transporter [Vagococcus penaei]